MGIAMLSSLRITGNTGSRLLLLVVTLATVGVMAEPVFQDRTALFLNLNGAPVSDTNVKKLGLADFNNDGAEDIVVARRADDAVLLMNDAGTLSQQSTFFGAAGFSANAYDAATVDVNGDGWTDIVFGRLSNRPSLYLNLGNDLNGDWLGFDNGQQIASGAQNATMIEAGDIDGDNDADLVMLTAFGNRRVLINDGMGNFANETSARVGSNVLNDVGKIQLGDVDNDGDLDVIAIFGSENIQSNFLNDGNGNFPNNLQQQLDLANLTYMPVGEDFNGDGLFDFRVYADNFSPTAFMSTGNIVGGFPEYIRRFDADMIGDNGKHGFAHIRDVDNDGDPDYIMSSIEMLGTGLNPDPRNELNEMVINDGVFSGDFLVFADPEWRSEESYDVLFIDVNLDGNLDVFFAHEGRYAIYINDADPAVVELTGIEPVIMQAGVADTMKVTSTGGVAPNYEWSISDGNMVSTGSSSELSYTFAEPGRYQVTVTLTDTAGSDQLTFWQLVHAPLTTNTPKTSSTILFQENAGADDLVWTVNTDNDSITVIDAVNKQFLQEIAVGSGPSSIAQVAPNRLWVINKTSGTISEVLTDTFEALEVVALSYGSAPHGLVVSNDGALAYVSLEGRREVLKIDTTTGDILQTLDMAWMPRHLALSADGAQLYVSRFITGPVPGESSRDVSTSGGGEIALVETASMSEINTITLPYNDVIDTSDSARGVPNYVMGVALSRDADIGVVPSNVSNIYRGTFRDGNAREHDRLVRSLLARIDVDSKVENVMMRFDFDDNSQPTAVVFGPTGNYLFVVHEGSRSLHILDVYANQIVVTREAGVTPRGLVLSSDRSKLFVNNYLDRTVLVYDISALMNGEANVIEESAVVETVVAENLNPFILQGKKFFFDAADSRLSSQAYVACASCHDDAGHDGRVWDFSDGGEGLRNTIDLRGRAGIGHGNVHWTANFDEIHDFENDIRGVFDGTGLMGESDFLATEDILGAPKSGLSSDLDALATYTATLTDLGDSPYREANGAFTPEALSGQALFATSNCARCHSGTQFTDSPAGGNFHNIGTVDADTGGRLGQELPNGGLDTPTLRGLWHGAPYLHDGSAATVSDAILAHTNTAVTGFDVPSLNAGQIADLTAYVLQIDDAETTAPAAVGEFPPYAINPGAQEGSVNDVVSLALVANADDGSALSFTANDLPDGLVIDSATGVISGTLSAGGLFNVSITVGAASTSLVTTLEFTWLALGDADGDSILDHLDNCSLVTNPDQLDTNGDGFGNACDADVNNDCVINFLDLVVLQGDFLSSGSLDTDLNGDGVVNFLDIATFSNNFLAAPGPSGLSTSCPTQ